jgi:hypothetical protein
MTTFTQKPGAILDYPFDWGPNLAAAGDAIVTSSFTIVNGIINSTAVSGNVLTAFVSGLEGAMIALTSNITTATRSLSETEYIRVRANSLIVEDGSGLATSESYCSVQTADLYHSDRGNAAWALLTTSLKEGCLRRATDYMLGQYRLRWKGRRVLITQALDWPRVGVVVEDFGGGQGRAGMGSYGLFQILYTIVPNEVIYACADLALRASTSTLAADQSQKAIEKTVGPIKIVYDPDSSLAVFYRQVDQILRVYMIAGGNSNVVSLLRS